MTLRVFHRQPGLASGAEVELSRDESHYLVRVRRAREGDAIDIIDGEAIHDGVVITADARSARVRVERQRESPRVPPIALGLGLPDPKATLEAITLACEAGVDTIDLVRCEHSHHAVPSTDRIDRVVEAAQRQCGRPRRPAVNGPVALPDWLAAEDDRPGFVAAPTPPAGTRTHPPDRGMGARVLIGPEGGLSPSEVDAAVAAGFLPLSLGPWILRTPTAAAVAVGLLLADASNDLGSGGA